MQQLHLKKHGLPGKLVVFEGTDGAGKSTILEMSAQFLQKRYPGKLHLTKQPTHGARTHPLFLEMMFNEKPNASYRAVQLLTLSDRLQQVRTEILPALREGKIILCDRYIYTSVANMLARGYRRESWFFRAAKEIVRPDLAVLSYAPPEAAIARIRGREAEKDRYLDETLLKNVAGEFVKMRKSARFLVLNTLQPPEEAFIPLKRRLEELFVPQ